MNYLKTYKLFETSKIDAQLKEILSNDGWERKEPSEDHWELELVYQLTDDVYIDVIKLSGQNHLNYYLNLKSDGSFNYVGQFDNNYTYLFKFSPYLDLSNYERMMKICNYLLPYFQKRPSDETIDNIKECFIDIQDMASVTETDWGYCSYDENCFFPAFRFSDKLCLCIFYEISKEIPFDKVKEEFEGSKSRLDIYGIHPSRAEIKEDDNWFNDQKYRFIIQISYT